MSMKLDDPSTGLASGMVPLPDDEIEKRREELRKKIYDQERYMAIQEERYASAGG